jgi:hypothetical protein
MLKEARKDSPQGKARASSTSAVALGRQVHKMVQAPSPALQEVPMLKVAHPWMKNRNVVHGGTVFSFNKDGTAEVAEVGTVKEDIAGLLRLNRGYFIPDEKEEVKPLVTPPPVPEKAPEPKKAPEAVKEVKESKPAPKTAQQAPKKDLDSGNQREPFQSSKKPSKKK